MLGGGGNVNNIPKRWPRVDWCMCVHYGSRIFFQNRLQGITMYRPIRRKLSVDWGTFSSSTWHNSLHSRHWELALRTWILNRVTHTYDVTVSPTQTPIPWCSTARCNQYSDQYRNPDAGYLMPDVLMASCH